MEFPGLNKAKDVIHGILVQQNGLSLMPSFDGLFISAIQEEHEAGRNGNIDRFLEATPTDPVISTSFQKLQSGGMEVPRTLVYVLSRIFLGLYSESSDRAACLLLSLLSHTKFSESSSIIAGRLLDIVRKIHGDKNGDYSAVEKELALLNLIHAISTGELIMGLEGIRKLPEMIESLIRLIHAGSSRQPLYTSEILFLCFKHLYNLNFNDEEAKFELLAVDTKATNAKPGSLDWFYRVTLQNSADNSLDTKTRLTVASFLLRVQEYVVSRMEEMKDKCKVMKRSMWKFLIQSTNSLKQKSKPVLYDQFFKDLLNTCSFSHPVHYLTSSMVYTGALSEFRSVDLVLDALLDQIRATKGRKDGEDHLFLSVKVALSLFIESKRAYLRLEKQDPPDEEGKRLKGNIFQALRHFMNNKSLLTILVEGITSNKTLKDFTSQGLKIILAIMGHPHGLKATDLVLSSLGVYEKDFQEVISKNIKFARETDDVTTYIRNLKSVLKEYPASMQESLSKDLTLLVKLHLSRRSCTVEGTDIDWTDVLITVFKETSHSDLDLKKEGPLRKMNINFDDRIQVLMLDTYIRTFLNSVDTKSSFAELQLQRVLGMVAYFIATSISIAFLEKSQQTTYRAQAFGTKVLYEVILTIERLVGDCGTDPNTWVSVMQTFLQRMYLDIQNLVFDNNEIYKLTVKKPDENCLVSIHSPCKYPVKVYERGFRRISSVLAAPSNHLPPRVTIVSLMGAVLFSFPLWLRFPSTTTVVDLIESIYSPIADVVTSLEMAPKETNDDKVIWLGIMKRGSQDKDDINLYMQDVATTVVAMMQDYMIYGYDDSNSLDTLKMDNAVLIHNMMKRSLQVLWKMTNMYASEETVTALCDGSIRGSVDVKTHDAEGDVLIESDDINDAHALDLFSSLRDNEGRVADQSDEEIALETGDVFSLLTGDAEAEDRLNLPPMPSSPEKTTEDTLTDGQTEAFQRWCVGAFTNVYNNLSANAPPELTRDIITSLSWVSGLAVLGDGISAILKTKYHELPLVADKSIVALQKTTNHFDKYVSQIITVSEKGKCELSEQDMEAYYELLVRTQGYTFDVFEALLIMYKAIVDTPKPKKREASFKALQAYHTKRLVLMNTLIDIFCLIEVMQTYLLNCIDRKVYGKKLKKEMKNVVQSLNKEPLNEEETENDYKNIRKLLSSDTTKCWTKLMESKDNIGKSCYVIYRVLFKDWLERNKSKVPALMIHRITGSKSARGFKIYGNIASQLGRASMEEVMQVITENINSPFKRRALRSYMTSILAEFQKNNEYIQCSMTPISILDIETKFNKSLAYWQVNQVTKNKNVATIFNDGEVGDNLPLSKRRFVTL